LVNIDQKRAFYKELKIAIFAIFGIFGTALKCIFFSPKMTKFDESALFLANFMLYIF